MKSQSDELQWFNYKIEIKMKRDWQREIRKQNTKYTSAI